MPYIIQFRVKGALHFPFDQLRRCSAAPRSEDDAESCLASPTDWKGIREIELVLVANSARAARFQVNEDRWRSFGWAVVRVDKPEKVTEQVAQQVEKDSRKLRERNVIVNLNDIYGADVVAGVLQVAARVKDNWQDVAIKDGYDRGLVHIVARLLQYGPENC